MPYSKKTKKKLSKRTEAFQKIIKNDVSGEIETNMQLARRGKNVIQKMECKNNICLKNSKLCLKNSKKSPRKNWRF